MEITMAQAQGKEAFRARVTMLLLGIGLSVEAIACLTEVVGVMQRDGISEDGRLLLDTLIGLQGLAQLLIFLATAVFFGMWEHRANSNLRLFDDQYVEYKPGWAVGWYFIPFANLVKPYQAMLEIWKGSDPTVPPNDPDARKAAPIGLIPRFWWAFWIISNIAGNFAGRASMRMDYRGEEVMLLNAFSDAMGVFSCLAAFLLVREVHHRQTLIFKNMP